MIAETEDRRVLAPTAAALVPPVVDTVVDPILSLRATIAAMISRTCLPAAHRRLRPFARGRPLVAALAPLGLASALLSTFMPPGTAFLNGAGLGPLRAFAARLPRGPSIVAARTCFGRVRMSTAVLTTERRHLCLVGRSARFLRT